MARVEAKAIQIENAYVTILQAIDSVALPNSYLTKPKTVRRGHLFADATLGSVPALYVQCSPWTLIDRNSRHQKNQGVGIVCVTTSIDALYRLEADVMFAIFQSHTHVPLADGSKIEQIKILDGDPQYRRERREQGLSISLINTEASYVLDHSAAT